MKNSTKYSTSPPSGRVLEAAILSHMGCESLAEKALGADAAQRARDMRATSLVDICRAALRIEGIETPHGRDGLIRAALSTYSLPVALGDAANKVLMNSYAESPASARPFNRPTKPRPCCDLIFPVGPCAAINRKKRPQNWEGAKATGHSREM